MAALQCEICGGKLMAKAGGIFECDSCGMQYDKTRIQEMVQEIKGTVKVEGTVEVQGTVKVDGPVKVDLSANVQSLLKRGDMALSEKKWEKAREFYQEALSIQETCWEAHFGLFLEECREPNRKCFEEYYSKHSFAKKATYDRLQKLAPPEILQWLADIEKRYKEYVEQKALEKEAKEKRQEDERIRRIAKLKRVRERIKPASELLSVNWYRTVCVTENGDVIATSKDGKGFRPKWHGLSSVAAGDLHTIGLRRDGTVVTNVCFGGELAHENAQFWRNIVKVVTTDKQTYGLKEDGTVVAVGVGIDEKTASSMNQWKDIVDLVVASGDLYGLKADGTVVSTTGKLYWENLVSVAGDSNFTAWLTDDGKVSFSGPRAKQYHLPNQDYVAIAAGDGYLLALRADGTVDECHIMGALNQDACQVSSWKNIVAIAASKYHSVGLREDGTLVAAGRPLVSDDYRQCDVGGWKLFQDYDSFLKNYVPQKERLAHERDKRQRDLNEEKARLQSELMNLKGMLAGRRRKQIEARLAEIETELKGL